MEAKKKDGGNPITHGCIIAKATVIIPDVMLPNPNYVINNPMLNSRFVLLVYCSLFGFKVFSVLTPESFYMVKF